MTAISMLEFSVKVCIECGNLCKWTNTHSLFQFRTIDGAIPTNVVEFYDHAKLLTQRRKKCCFVEDNTSYMFELKCAPQNRTCNLLLEQQSHNLVAQMLTSYDDGAGKCHDFLV